MTALPLLTARESLLTAESNSTPKDDDLPPARLFKVPDSAPPFDGELPPASPCGAGYDAPCVPAPRQTPAPQLPAERVGPGPDTGAAAVTASGSAGTSDWPRQFARLLTEVLSGSRPAQQIMPWLTRRGQHHLRHVAPVFNCGQRPRVLRVLSSQPSATVVEMSVIVCAGTRTRALALRLEQVTIAGQPARWLCTDIETA